MSVSLSLATVLALVVLLGIAACGETPSPPAAPPAAPPARAVELKIACLNIWGVPLVSKDLDGRLERMLPAVRRLDPDVICFQEVFLSSVRKRVLAGLGTTYSATEGTGGGLLIASRHPIRDAAFTAYPMHAALALTERLARKGYLEAVLETPAGCVRVVTTHLAAEWTEGGPKDGQRKHLVATLQSRKDLALVLAGDLNTTMVRNEGPTDAYRAFRAAGFESANPPRKSDMGLWFTPEHTRVGWPRSGQWGWTPDHVFVRNGPAVAVEVVSYAVTLETPATAVSDHNLLLTTVRLSPRP